MNAPSINTLLTVIICTYNRAFILGDCLESLTRQTAPAESFEVIIIDNNSTDNTEEVVASFTGRVPGLKLIKETRQGAGYARNTGIAAANGEWIACLDSDGKVCFDWVSIILQEIRKGHFDCFGGPYYAWHRFGPPPMWWDGNFGTYLGPNRYDSLGDFHIAGGTCAFKKSLAEAVGGFPVDIGMKGKKCAYGEETLLFEKMRWSGARLGFVPSMRIDHCVLPYKYSLRWRLLSSYASGRDSFFLSSCSIGRAVLRLGKTLVWNMPAKFMWCRRQKFLWQRTVLECICPVLFHLGAVYASIRRHVYRG